MSIKLILIFLIVAVFVAILAHFLPNIKDYVVLFVSLSTLSCNIVFVYLSHKNINEINLLKEQRNDADVLLLISSNNFMSKANICEKLQISSIDVENSLSRLSQAKRITRSERSTPNETCWEINNSNNTT
jgi:hypothetical protein